MRGRNVNTGKTSKSSKSTKQPKKDGTKEFTNGNSSLTKDEPKPLSSILRTLKTKFQVQLIEEQKNAYKEVAKNKVTFLTGKAGTSKTFLACYIALSMLSNGEIKKIIITRPNVESSEQSQGFLPGEGTDPLSGKMQPFLVPIIDNLNTILGDERLVVELIRNKIIDVAPIQYVRGRNFKDCCVICDESQNFTTEELKTVSTRLCIGSKIIFCSDYRQIDLKKKFKSASRFIDIITKLDGVGHYELTVNHRDPLAILIMEAIEAEEERILEENNKLKK